MKGDMSGGAGTLHGIGALAALGTPVRAIAVLAAAENLPGGDAFRPGDILRAANGKTIEVINTDAEGRLVLADALWYVRREGATHVLDLATLTGAMELALGDLYAGVFANDERVARARRRGRARAAATSSGRSRFIPLPPLHRLGLRGHEERLHAAPGLARSRRRVPARVRRRRARGATSTWPGPRSSSAAAATTCACPAAPAGASGSSPSSAGRSLELRLRDEQELIRRTVREFAETKVAPVAEELDREARFPYELVAELGELGLMGLPIPEEYGGAGGRHRLLCDRDRGADADRLLRRDHRRGAHVARHDADPPLRQRGAEARVAAAARVG